MRDVTYIISDRMVEVRQELCGQRGVHTLPCFCNVFCMLFQIPSSHSAPAAADAPQIRHSCGYKNFGCKEGNNR